MILNHSLIKFQQANVSKLISLLCISILSYLMFTDFSLLVVTMHSIDLYASFLLYHVSLTFLYSLVVQPYD